MCPPHLSQGTGKTGGSERESVTETMTGSEAGSGILTEIEATGGTGTGEIGSMRESGRGDVTAGETEAVTGIEQREETGKWRERNASHTLRSQLRRWVVGVCTSGNL